jgi:glyoxylase-like metal-dependent hydrolase (beta-lactamase superfamily II)
MSRPSAPRRIDVSEGGAPHVAAFFDARTCSLQYVVADPRAGQCALIDPVLDFDETSGSTATVCADALLDYVAAQGWRVGLILDTHPHADHFSAAAYCKAKTGAPMAIGDRVVEVQALWRDIYGLPAATPCDGSQWDLLLADGDRFKIGGLEGRTIFSPGHTLASATYHVGDAAFIHDSLLMPDFGTARCDFPGGDARRLWRSIARILALPDATRLFVGHDYMPGGREPRCESSVAEQRAENRHLRQARTEDRFVEMRRERDATLPMPKLILHALQVNIAGGRLPEPEADGRRFLKIPIDAFPDAVWG